MSKTRYGWLVGGVIALVAGAAVAAEPIRIERAVGPGKQTRVLVMRHGDQEERLKNLLQLRPAQEAALKAFINATKPRRDHVMHLNAAAGRKTTPERLSEMEKRLAEQQAEGRARIEATRAFYAQLDASQKKAFDELPLMMAPHGFGPIPMGPMPIRHELPPAPPSPPLPPHPPAPPAGI